jgi:hypothetical protein
LVTLWRETLLAQKVLKGKTKGFRDHPQLKRFKKHTNPAGAIANYLMGVWEEARMRGYNFDKGKIGIMVSTKKIPVTKGQLKYELDWLCHKLKKRNPGKRQKLLCIKKIDSHPIFKIIDGEIEEWEKIKLNPG